MFSGGGYENPNVYSPGMPDGLYHLGLRTSQPPVFAAGKYHNQSEWYMPSSGRWMMVSGVVPESPLPEPESTESFVWR